MQVNYIELYICGKCYFENFNFLIFNFFNVMFLDVFVQG